jgi:hypothetical protein
VAARLAVSRRAQVHKVSQLVNCLVSAKSINVNHSSSLTTCFCVIGHH